MINTVLILQFMKDNNYSNVDFAKKCKVGVVQLRTILTKKDIFPIIPLYKIARIMGVNLRDLYSAMQ